MVIDASFLSVQCFLKLFFMWNRPTSIFWRWGHAISVYQSLILSKCSKLIVIIISIEHCLERVSPEISKVLFELGIFQIFPLLTNVLLVKVVFFWWNEWSSDFPIIEILPRKIFEPWVILYFARSIEAQSFRRFSQNHFVDKVSCFDWPAPWNLILFNLNLHRHDVIPNFLPWFAKVGPLSKHALKCHDTDSKVVYNYCMVGSTHDFWCHVAWCSRSILRVFRPLNSCNTKISNAQIAEVIND